MQATMMTMPLSIPSILRHASTYHGDTEIVSRTFDGAIHRYDYAGAWRRTQQLANALGALDLAPGDRVGTLAWNGHRHFEIYYAVSGCGMVCHTINPRLFRRPDRLHHKPCRQPGAVCRSVFRRSARNHRRPARSSDRNRSDDRPGAYADLVETPDTRVLRGAACGSAGALRVAGVGREHRVRHVLHLGHHRRAEGCAVQPPLERFARDGGCLPDVFGLDARSVVLPIVPMFHVNAWGLPYAAPMVGAKLVLCGARLAGASLHELITAEDVTFSAGVPTVWMTLLDWAAANQKTLAGLDRVIIGGAAMPPVLVDRLRAHGIEARHAWGMTETSPAGLANALKPRHRTLPIAASTALAAKQGRPIYGMEFSICDDEGRELAHDGVAFGSLLVRGPWVAASYYRQAPTRVPARAGWFDTGDVVTMDADGYVQIVDRTNDVIKSGGEWICSIELENIAVAHPAIREAAVVARPDARWGERPILVAVLQPDGALDRDAMVAHYTGKVAKWCIPDDIVIAPELSHTATGKLLKSRIRELYCAVATTAPS